MKISDLTGRTRVAVAALLAATLLLGACSSTFDDTADSVDYDESEHVTTVVYASDEGKASGSAEGEEARTIAIAAAPIGTDPSAGLKVIRDGRVELRVEPGTFGQISSQLRSIAQDLGGYITRCGSPRNVSTMLSTAWMGWGNDSASTCPARM